MEIDGQVSSQDLPCYICDGDHIEDECPIRIRVNVVLAAKKEENSTSLGQEEARRVQP